MNDLHIETVQCDDWHCFCTNRETRQVRNKATKYNKLEWLRPDARSFHSLIRAHLTLNYLFQYFNVLCFNLIGYGLFSPACRFVIVLCSSYAFLASNNRLSD